jgi:hypothetical protein
MGVREGVAAAATSADRIRRSSALWGRSGVRHSLRRSLPSTITWMAKTQEIPRKSRWMSENWRRGRDSNPWKPFDFNGFQDRRLKPLGHLSALGSVRVNHSGRPSSLRHVLRTTRLCHSTGLLTDGAVRSDHDGKARFVAVARRGGVLNQPHVIREDIAGDRTCRVLIARVLVVHPERHARVDGYVGQGDLIPIWRHGLKRDGGEGAPAGVRVSGADAVGAGKRRGREVAAPRC